ncbi:hypothetical protein GGR57DRAFT_158027 [Xylariaceae sp. FL1272]|nr:hypothetical protein GGR57DRAFT_158027 [Xylariaceae sp. FL1272]
MFISNALRKQACRMTSVSSSRFQSYIRSLSTTALRVVLILRLLKCKAREEARTQMLCFPRALKELWCEIDVFQWEDTEAVSFTCPALERALQPQVDNLKRLSSPASNTMIFKFSMR